VTTSTICRPSPFGTALDAITEDWHVGVKDFTDFILKHKPLLAISGHIHESYKQKQVMGKTLLVNPGGDGEIFEIDGD
jgi:Icc-related predicted phosphoesterase